MTHGAYVLDLLREGPATAKTILLIRHSHRDSFHGVPDALREGVEITPEGIRMARAFGESLRQVFPGTGMVLSHTPARRCRMTAESIGSGYASPGRVRVVGCHPEVGSVVADQEQYIRLREESGWHRLMKEWLDGGVADTVLENPRTYCNRTMQGLVSFSRMHPEDLQVVIAHDVTIFPLLSGIFGETVTSLEFLNGIVITGDTSSFEIRFADADHAWKAAWDMPRDGPALREG